MNDHSSAYTIRTRDQETTSSGCSTNCVSGQPQAPKRKLPLWAVLIAAGGFAIFNIIFIGYAMSVSTNQAGQDEKYWSP